MLPIHIFLYICLYYSLPPSPLLTSLNSQAEYFHFSDFPEPHSPLLVFLYNLTESLNTLSGFLTYNTPTPFNHLLAHPHYTLAHNQKRRGAYLSSSPIMYKLLILYVPFLTFITCVLQLLNHICEHSNREVN